MQELPEASLSDPADGRAVDMEIVASLRRIIRAVDLHSRRLVEECGLTGPQLLVLQAAERHGRVSLGTLAAFVHLSQATVSGVLDRLAARGLLERGRDERDRRSAYVVVTAAGRRLMSRAPSLLHHQFQKELAKLRPWERTMLLSSLQRIAEMMDADRIDASPVLTVGPVHAADPVHTAVVGSSTRAGRSRDANPYEENIREDHSTQGITTDKARREQSAAASGRSAGRRR